MFYTYVLYSEKFDQIYIGQSNDINNILFLHNRGKVKSTKRFMPWIFIYHEGFETRAEAMKREKQLKTHKGRDFIRSLVRVRRLPD